MQDSSPEDAREGIRTDPGPETAFPPASDEPDPSPPQPEPRVRVSGAFATWLIVVALFVVGGLALQRWGGELGARPLSVVAQVGFVLLPTLIAIWLSRVPVRRILPLRPIRPLLLVVTTLTTLFLLPALMFATVLLYPWFPDVAELEESMRELIGADSAWEMALVLGLAAVLPALCEEALFRGYLLNGLRQSISAPRALTAQALLFALLHGHPVRILPMFLLGLWLGWLVLRTGTLLAPIMAHGAYNGVIVLLAQGAPEPGAPPPTPTFDTTTLVEFGLTVALFALGAGVLLLLTRRSGS